MIFAWSDIVEPSGTKCSNEAVTEFEVELGYDLPDDFRSFLVNVNGGRVRFDHDIPVPELFTVFVAYLYPLTASSPFLGIVEARRDYAAANIGVGWAIQIGGDAGTGFFFNRRRL